MDFWSVPEHGMDGQYCAVAGPKAANGCQSDFPPRVQNYVQIRLSNLLFQGTAFFDPQFYCFCPAGSRSTLATGDSSQQKDRECGQAQSNKEACARSVSSKPARNGPGSGYCRSCEKGGPDFRVELLSGAG